MFGSCIVTITQTGMHKPLQNLLCIQHQSRSSHSFQPEAKPPVQLVPTAAWPAPKSKRGAGFIHTSKHRDIRQILTETSHRGFCAGERLKIGCHQDLGLEYKQIIYFISHKGLSMKLHAAQRYFTCIRGKFETSVRKESLLCFVIWFKCPHCGYELSAFKPKTEILPQVFPSCCRGTYMNYFD